jgi:hypothetical protein
MVDRGAPHVGEHAARAVFDVTWPQGERLPRAQRRPNQDLDQVTYLVVGLRPLAVGGGAPGGGRGADRRDLLEGERLRRAPGLA